MIEVEIKIRTDLESAELKLMNNGFEPDVHVKETDIYFDNVNGDIRGNDTALRIRTIKYPDSAISRSYITYKGNRFDDVSMTRPEYESSISNADDVARILEALGYSPVKPTVIKERSRYVKEDISACLDRVEGLGDFLELEILTDEDTKDAALARLWKTLELLGYDRSETTTVSYLSMLQMK